MIECQINLRGLIIDWSYRNEVQLTGNRPFSKGLYLSGETEHTGFIKRMPFSVNVFSELETFSKDEMSDMNTLEIIKNLQDYDIPDMLEVAIPVNCSQLVDLRECLMSASKTPHLSVEIQLCIEGLQKAPNKPHEIQPIEGRAMIVNEFAWYLHSNKECISQDGGEAK